MWMILRWCETNNIIGAIRRLFDGVRAAIAAGDSRQIVRNGFIPNGLI